MKFVGLLAAVMIVTVHAGNPSTLRGTASTPNSDSDDYSLSSSASADSADDFGISGDTLLDLPRLMEINRYDSGSVVMDVEDLLGNKSVDQVTYFDAFKALRLNGTGYFESGNSSSGSNAIVKLSDLANSHSASLVSTLRGIIGSDTTDLNTLMEALDQIKYYNGAASEGDSTSLETDDSSSLKDLFPGLGDMELVSSSTLEDMFGDSEPGDSSSDSSASLSSAVPVQLELGQSTSTDTSGDSDSFMNGSGSEDTTVQQSTTAEEEQEADEEEMQQSLTEKKVSSAKATKMKANKSLGLN